MTLMQSPSTRAGGQERICQKKKQRPQRGRHIRSEDNQRANNNNKSLLLIRRAKFGRDALGRSTPADRVVLLAHVFLEQC
jgi:hypothetical protein